MPAFFGTCITEAVVGAAIKAGRLAEFTQVIQQLGENPDMANKELSISLGADSQVRARTVMGQTDAVTPASLQEIGRAAMAAHNAPDDKYVGSINALLGRQARNVS